MCGYVCKSVRVCVWFSFTSGPAVGSFVSEALFPSRLCDELFIKATEQLQHVGYSRAAGQSEGLGQKERGGGEVEDGCKGENLNERLQRSTESSGSTGDDEEGDSG